ncbi:TlpA family protein disulfide reductase [Flavivirga jejuensis]|uniref:TlpA disulfide reductase family protein n=1 Tax=Flavivirga jejuensis TaxID=870487 RepID=A0ABT8WMI0_9FLAO|nr:TlpA disulfide reductase family protein [Flavivirga jejuensis]MDO5974333.1 TlpA disulfide reductase family protein [Flavivirga jejuensis]
MKKITFIFLLTLLLGFSINAQKTIKNPSFEVTISGITHISKIELNINDTRIYIHSTFLPKWWVNFEKDLFIKDCETGKKYTIKEVEGVAFGERIFMPESGEKTNVLIFPPLDTNVKKIDYSDQIFGISLLKKNKRLVKTKEVPESVSKWLGEELAKVTAPPVKDFNASQFFNKSAARLVGYIKGYDPRLGFETGIMYMGNDITREDYPVVIQVHPDGRFEADIPLTNPIYSRMSFKRSMTFNLYLEPQQTLAMIIDWEEFLIADKFRNKRHKFKNVIFKGPLARINEDLSGFELKEINYKAFNKKIKKLSPEAFKKEKLGDLKENKDNLTAYLSNNTITPKAAVLLKNNMLLEHATQLFDFIRKRDYEARKDTINDILKTPVANDYYDFLQDMPLNNQSLLVLDKFGTFVNRFEFSKPILIYPKRKKSALNLKPEKTLLEYFKEAGIIISEKDKELIELQKKNPLKSAKEYNEQRKLFSDAYKNGSKAYSKKYVQPLMDAQSKVEKISMEKWRLRDSVVTNIFKLEKNLVYDMVKIRALDFDIKRSNSKSAHEYWETLKNEIVHPFLKEEGDRVVNKKFPMISTQKNIDGNMNTRENIQAITTKLPEGRATDVFRKIIEPFKGKILFVDFWATSCAPCVGGIKRMKDTRKEYEGNKDFDFIFITDERSSTIGKYTKFVEEQELKNTYRLSLDDYNYLRQLFKFNGIPKYVVIDKNGDVINDNFSMYLFDYLLDGILEKYK